MIGLTPTQSACLAFIREYVERTGASPSYTEIGAHLGSKSRGWVGSLIKGLEARGAIRRIKGRYRSLQLVEPDKMNTVLLNEEIHRLLGAYASEHSIALDTAANELLRQTLTVEAS